MEKAWFWYWKKRELAVEQGQQHQSAPSGQERHDIPAFIRYTRHSGDWYYGLPEWEYPGLCKVTLEQAAWCRCMVKTYLVKPGCRMYQGPVMQNLIAACAWGSDT